MSYMASFLLFLFIFSLAFLSIGTAQDRAPHGIAYENPMALSPSAYEFFHPKDQTSSAKKPCAESNCAPLPLAAQVEATQQHESKSATAQKGGSRMGAGAIAGIVFGFVFAVFLTMGVYHVVTMRRNNMNRANSVQPDA
ncbi:uncharacterized protein LOC131148938 [Malania oleifera]|uniref:uncharacterized protein LOC131148938 n=1 Tax=Malania oleifera TaxID=397392 RepID=UPI0025ADA3A2|nr:uncharacterized protein LOC131148938 [Malania oleifera]